MAGPAGTGVDQLPLVGYIRVSTYDQAENGAGLLAQRQTIITACERTGQALLGIIEEQASGKSVKDRPELRRALRLIARGRAGGIVAAQLLDRSLREGWPVIVCDLAMDTRTPEGAAMAYVLMAWAELERRRIAQRTREALAVKRAQGVRLGRPSGLAAVVRNRIATDRTAGAGWSEIAKGLNRDAVPTCHGATQWHPATVRYLAARNTP